nr:nucleotidyltransferase family protein [Algicella marina]
MRKLAPARPNISILLLAAGQSRRMGDRDKLLEEIGGQPLLRRSAKTAVDAGLAEVLVVVPPDATARRATLKGVGTRIVVAELAAEGMAASLRAGLAAISQGTDAVIVALADMPEVSVQTYAALAAAFAPDKGAEICRAVTEGGRPGHPVLFGTRFFESLGALEGDEGARSVLAEAGDFVRDVPVSGDAAILDLDTPEQWAEYRARSVTAE